MKFSRNPWAVFTVTIADPGVFTATEHELYINDTVELETSGSLPTGLEEYKTYYVIKNGLTADVFQLSESKGGDAIVTTGSQSGTQKFLKTNRARLSPNVENNK